MSVLDYAEEQEIDRFEDETGVQYNDYFGEESQTIKTGEKPEDEKTVEEVSTLKDIALSTGSAFADFYRDMGAIGYNVGYGIASKMNTGEWQSPTQEDLKESWVGDGSPLYESKTVAGDVAHGIGKAAMGVVTGGTLLKGATGGVGLAKFAKTAEGVELAKKIEPVLTGMSGDMLAFWRDKENVTTLLQENIDNPIAKQALSYLAVEEDDGGAERALKQGIEGVLFGVGADAVFKGLKYIKSGFKDSKIAERLVKPIKPVLEESVEDKAEKTIVNAVAKDAKAVVDDGDKVVKEVAEELKIGGGMKARIAKMREAKPEKYARLRAKSLQKFSEATGMTYDNASTADVRKFVSESEDQLDNVIVAVENEESVINQSFERLKELRSSVEAGNVSDSTKNEVMNNVLNSIADSVASVQDAANISAKALGYTAREGVHSDIKKVINSIVDNADSVDRKAIFDIFSSANSTEELVDKFNKLAKTGEMGKSVGGIFGKKGFISSKIVPLMQAGLLSSAGTVLRNIYSGFEMIGLGVAESAVASGIGRARNLFRRALGKGENYDVASVRDALEMSKAFYSSVGEIFNYGFQRLAKKSDELANPFDVYRKRLEGGKTYLARQVRYTFNPDSGMGRLLNGWMRVSGVGVSESIDDFMGNVFYRARVGMLANDYANKVAAEKGLKASEKEAFRNKFFNDIMDVDYQPDIDAAKMFDDSMFNSMAEYSVSRKAKEYALENTFRKGTGKVDEMVKKVFDVVPEARMFQPFITTTTRIAFDRFLGDRTFLGLLSPRSLSIMKGGRLGDELAAKQIVGNGLLFTGASLMASGNLTGDIPTSPAERALWKAQGIKPNSIVIHNDDGTKSYYDIDKFGPLFKAVQTGGIIAQALAEREAEAGEDENLAKAIMYNSILAGYKILGEATESSALKYIGDTLGAITNNDKKKVDKVIQAVAELPLNLVPRDIAKVGELFNDENEVKQVANDYFDKFKKKFGIATQDQLDFLGEPVYRDKEAIFPFNGVTYSQTRNRAVLDEMERVGAFVQEPNKDFTARGVRVELTNDEVYRVKENMKKLGAEKKMEKFIKGRVYSSIDNKEARKKVLKNQYNSIKKQAYRMEYESNADLRERFEKGMMDKIVLTTQPDDEYNEIIMNENTIPTLR